MTPIEWMMAGKTGVSSMTILHVMEGTSAPRGGGDVPHDPSDFGRCHGLLEAFPQYRKRLGEVAAKYPTWVGLVREWPKLTAMYVASKESGKWEAPSLYDAMRELIDEGRIAAGWERTQTGWRSATETHVSMGGGASIVF